MEGRHWIPAQGRRVQELIGDLLRHGASPADIFLISPFRDVVGHLHGLAQQFPGLKAGTIHTVQGKESPVVILVLGGDPQRPGAKGWASSRPNLLNVAVSRAKRRLYMIGDRSEWGEYPYFSTCSSIFS